MTRTHQANLPDGWELADLRAVAEVNPKLDKSALADTLRVSFVPMPAVEAKTGAINVSETRHLEDVKRGYTPFREGDVLFAKITPCMENGKMAVVPALTNGLGFGSTEFHVLRPYREISAEYIYYFVSSESFRRNAGHHMTGAVGQRRVPTPYLAEQPVPVPPPQEQHRIVAKIYELFSELDRGVESLQTAREQLNVYRQAVLKRAFEGKLTGEWRSEHLTASRPSWRDTMLGSVLSLVTSGSRGWAAYYSEQGDIFIRAQDLKYDRLALDDVAFVSLPKETSEGTRTRVQVGDVLITITGANVTKTGLVRSDIGTAYVSQHVALARPTEAIMPEFLYWFLVAEAGGRSQLNAASYGAGKPGLNLANIRSVAVPLPSLAEQEEIVTCIDTLLSITDNTQIEIDRRLQQVETLRQAILKAAFSGNLVDQVPDDEPASALLERIKTESASAEKKPGKGRRRVAS
ncbi:MAG TPA: restriction endonuclease subunit S [Actinomycetota bacterium]|nr:restriction endonuclease subunit S [Actinomycetota bacterium]